MMLIRRLLLIFVTGLTLGFSAGSFATWGKIVPQDNLKLTSKSSYTAVDPLITTKLDILADKIEGVRIETVRNREAILTLKGDMDIGKGIGLAVGAVGVMTFINMMVSMVCFRKRGMNSEK